METSAGSIRLAGADLVEADLHGAWVRESDLRGLTVRGSDLSGADIDGVIDGLRVNGVEVRPLVEAELDRRHPERVALRATDAASYRSGWAGLEAMWAPTMARAAALPPGSVDVSIDGEWSFAQTLRHLVCATDLWVNGAVLGRADPHHPIGLFFSGWDEQAATLVDLDAAPTYDEVLAARAERVATVREVMATLTDDRLRDTGVPPSFVSEPEVTVAKALWVIMNEEWHHHRFATRDLAVVESRIGGGPPLDG